MEVFSKDPALDRKARIHLGIFGMMKTVNGFGRIKRDLMRATGLHQTRISLQDSPLALAALGVTRPIEMDMLT